MALAPGARLGVYEIRGALGAGGMGEVYRAHDTRLGRDVAVKILPPAFTADADRLARFEREARTLAAMNHPNIAQIHGLEASPPALVMELVAGEDLAERIVRGPMPIPEAIAIARQIADALDAAHEIGIIHRDLKPANVKVRDDGTVKVLDFGLAKATGPASGVGVDGRVAATVTSPAMTAMGLIIGTAAYMAPEQAKGRPADRRADVWAFGVVLYEMLTGTRLFDGPDVSETLAAVLTREPQWRDLPGTTPEAVRRLLARCLVKDPRRRLDSMSAVKLELDEAIATPTNAGGVPAAPSKARWPLVVPAALVVGGLVAGVALSRWVPSSVPATGQPAPPLVVNIAAAPEAVSAFTYGLALSPDASILVYSARTADGERHLWKRPLAEGRASVIPDTEGATYPFWSPDGRHLAFFRASELRRVPIGGGPAQLIARLQAAFYPQGSWNASDEILYSVGDNVRSAGIFRVPASGGTPQRLKLVGVASRPTWLPDGRRFLYLSLDADPARLLARLLAAAPEGSQPPVPIMDFEVGGASPDSDVRLSWDGTAAFLLFNHSGVLTRQELDLDRLRTTGPLLPVSDQAGTPRGLLAVSAAGQTVVALNPSVAATGGTPGDPISRLQWVDRAGRILGQVGPPRRYWTMQLSHDGLKVAVNYSHTLSVIDSRTNFEAPLDSTSIHGVWMPDDSGVVYRNYTSGNLQVKGLAGEAQPRVIAPGNGFSQTDVSPDGRWLLGTSRLVPDAGSLDLFLMSIADGSLKPLVSSEFDESEACFSPNGLWIAYVLNQNGRPEVYVRRVAGGDAIRVSADGGAHPMWPRNGHELFFLSPTDEVVAVDVRDLDRTGQPGARQTLFRTVMNDIVRDLFSPYAVGPNGDRFLLNVPEPPEPLTLLQNVGAKR